MTTLEKAARPSRIITIAFDGEDIDHAEHAYDAIEELLGRMGQVGTLHMGPEIPSIPAAALLDPSDEVLDEGCRAYWEHDGKFPKPWSEVESEKIRANVRETVRTVLHAVGVKITGRTE
jgi:hypothetical protein